MQFSGRGRRKLKLANTSQVLYPLSVHFYAEPPTENISLIEFETFAVDRLKLLKTVENLGVSYVKGTPNYKQKLELELKHLKFPFHALAEEEHEARRKDHISHFILRLAFCQSEELRRWFIQQEMDLFRYRFTQLNDSLIEKFLQYANLAYDIIPESEKEDIEDKLLHATHNFGPSDVKKNVFYRVPFCDAVDLVRVRQVYFHGGYAYVPLQDFLAIVLNSYRTKLSKALAILDLVKGMHYQLACQKYFEVTHNVDDIGFPLNHPNQYFAESQQLLSGIKEIKKEQKQPESSLPKQNSQKSLNSTSSSLNATEEMELEGLEEYFAED
ncbi:DNA primase large subunit isoform X4 [Varanus komodoensis]|uniref:DNA primase large subunit isoform X4 n=1 Tax=Varanus komodoensis TaxID=61221 RepID=UPI001CF7D515|nr:DNA primase large subunit isoform X4 [Varanus komodoensis]